MLNPINTTFDIADCPELFTKMCTSIDDGKKIGLWSGHPPIDKFVARKDVPEEITSKIKKYVSEYEAVFADVNLTIPQVPHPTLKLMQLVTGHYLKKYQIQINVCSAYAIEKELKEVESDEPFGIIAWSDDAYHVIPLLCDFSEGRKDIVSLDSVPAYWWTKNPGKAIYGTFQELSLNWKVASLPRLRDNGLCGVDALVILRNALLHIKLLKENGNYTDLGTLTLHSSNHKNKASLPLEWTYTSQRTPSQLKENSQSTLSATRGYFSSKPEKKAAPQLATSFRQQHTNTITMCYKLSLWNQNLRNLGSFDLNTLILPEDVSIKDEGFTTVVSWQTQLEVNTYLAEKSFRLAHKFL